jgi:hypothetical protein
MSLVSSAAILRRTACAVLIGATLFSSYVPGLVPKANATGAVTVVGGNGTIQETISAGANTMMAGLQTSLNLKEFTLDGIFNGLAKMMLRSMTQSIVNWINSGFQGSPAFVTDMKQFMLDRVDQVIGEYIYNDPALSFLCSPFQLDVRIALATSYQESTREGFGSEAQCTLSQVTDNVEGFLNGAFNEGGWQGWFEMTQNPVNTPTGAYLAAETEMYARIVDEQGNAIKELDWGDGFLSFKVCDDEQNQRSCDITTPGRVISDQINKSLGAGQDALISADEINEVISALFAQLAQQVMTGIGGLLGVSESGGGFIDPATGTTSTRSYLDAVGDAPEGGVPTNPFTRALETERENTTLQNRIVSGIREAEDALRDASATYPSCDLGDDFPEELTARREQAEARIVRNNANIVAINSLSTEFMSPETTPERRLALTNMLLQRQQNGTYTGLTENIQLGVYVRFELSQTLGDFTTALTRALMLCAGNPARGDDD